MTNSVSWLFFMFCFLDNLDWLEGLERLEGLDWLEGLERLDWLES